MISVQLGEKEALYMKNCLPCHTGGKTASSVSILYLYKKVLFLSVYVIPHIK